MLLEEKKIVWVITFDSQKKNCLEEFVKLEQLKLMVLLTPKIFKKQEAEEHKEKFLEKKMHGQFSREMPEEVDKEKSWYWLSRGDVEVETGALLCSAQEQALRTNYIKHHIDKSIDSPMCRMCGK